MTSPDDTTTPVVEETTQTPTPTPQQTTDSKPTADEHSPTPSPGDKPDSFFAVLDPRQDTETQNKHTPHQESFIKNTVNSIIDVAHRTTSTTLDWRVALPLTVVYLVTFTIVSVIASFIFAASLLLLTSGTCMLGLIRYNDSITPHSYNQQLIYYGTPLLFILVGLGYLIA